MTARGLGLLALSVAVAACSAPTADRPGASPSVSLAPSPSDEAAPTPSQLPSDAGSPSPARSGNPVCRDPHEHVYHPDRLELVNPCMTLSGVIDRRTGEADGDYHIRLHLDPEFAALVNGVNVSAEGGDLVAEPVCERPVTQEDAKAACQGVPPAVVIPPTHSHVFVTGAYVRDTVHGWMELHPVWEIRDG